MHIQDLILREILMDVRWIQLGHKPDSRGELIVAEAQKNIPFEIKRVYCLYGMKDEPRGFHAHKELEQVMICLAGFCHVTLDNGANREIVEMRPSSQGLFIDKMIWHEMHDFSSDCVLIVLASQWYDEGDYLRDYEEFLRAC